MDSGAAVVLPIKWGEGSEFLSVRSTSSDSTTELDEIRREEQGVLVSPENLSACSEPRKEGSAGNPWRPGMRLPCASASAPHLTRGEGSAHRGLSVPVTEAQRPRPPGMSWQFSNGEGRTPSLG